jgi:hypothetical protein
MPLSRNSSLKRSPIKTQRAKPAISPEVRELLQARSMGWCEARLPGCQGQATDAAHRIGRKMGGRPSGSLDRLSAVMHLCRVCHRWTHDRVEEARDLGLMLLEGQDPEVEPVAYQNDGWVRLQDDGGVWPV